jgi:dGTPase
VVAATTDTGLVGMRPAEAEALAVLRRFDYEHIYMRPASVRQAESVIRLLRALVERYADRPNQLPSDRRAGVEAGSPEAVRAAVTYVSGMTDRFACQQGLGLLGWDRAQLPKGVDTIW